MAVLEYLGPARAGLLISPGPGPPSQTGKNQGEFAGATDEPEKRCWPGGGRSCGIGFTNRTDRLKKGGCDAVRQGGPGEFWPDRVVLQDYWSGRPLIARR